MHVQECKGCKMNLPGKAFKHDARKRQSFSFCILFPFKCAHVGKRGLMRVLDMQNDCYNTVCVSSLPDPGLVQLHTACLSVPDPMAWIQQYC